MGGKAEVGLAGAVAGSADLPSAAAFTMEQLSSANSLFALELFRTLNESSPTGNIFFSPFSISSALAMVFLGAKGSTAAQLSKVSRSKTGQLSLPSPCYHPCLKAHLECFQSHGELGSVAPRGAVRHSGKAP